MSPDQYASAGCIGERDEGCLRPAECGLLSRCLLWSGCVGACTSLQMRAMHRSGMGPSQLVLHPHAPSSSPPGSTPVSPTILELSLPESIQFSMQIENLFCILGHSLPGKNSARTIWLTSMSPVFPPHLPSCLSHGFQCTLLSLWTAHIFM